MASSSRTWMLSGRALIALLAALGAPLLTSFACSPVEQVFPAPLDGGVSSSSSSGSSHGSSSGESGSSTSSATSSSTSSGGGGMGGNGGASSSGGGTAGGGGAAGAGGIGGAGGVGGMGMGGNGGGGVGGGPMDAGLCPLILETPPVEPSPHVLACSPVTYSTNPPTSGPHYPTWAAFKWYTTPVPRGYYVHSMEHGAVVIGYHCETGCDAELAALAAFLDARPADPMCVAPLKFRIIVTPDPLLDHKFGVSAWGALLKSDCLDLAALGAFLDAHYAKAPENFCFDGVDVTSPDAGVPADCGMAMDGGTDASPD